MSSTWGERQKYQAQLTGTHTITPDHNRRDLSDIDGNLVASAHTVPAWRLRKAVESVVIMVIVLEKQTVNHFKIVKREHV